MRGFPMNSTEYLYPGTFCPPTYGHVDIAVRAYRMVGNLTVVCSRNPDKSHNWFEPEEVVDLWSYYLAFREPMIRVVALDQIVAEKHDLSKVVMVRGIRNASDLAHEQAVMELNQSKYKIDKFLYLLAEPRYANISSTNARDIVREMDVDYQALHGLVDPAVAGAMVERYASFDGTAVPRKVTPRRYFP